MTKEEFEAFFESQCIPAGLSFDEIAKRWSIINKNLDTILPSKLYRFRFLAPVSHRVQTGE